MPEFDDVLEYVTDTFESVCDNLPDIHIDFDLHMDIDISWNDK